MLKEELVNLPYLLKLDVTADGEKLDMELPGITITAGAWIFGTEFFTGTLTGVRKAGLSAVNTAGFAQTAEAGGCAGILLSGGFAAAA